jgi:uncharacterized glyoxalase superfamily metalloenzyme YdcJ
MAHSDPRSAAFADKIQMQHRLFSELSALLGREVPLYEQSLLVNRVCNTAVCTLLSHLHRGFSITPEQLDKTSGERHGAIRIGRPDEYRWVTRFFAAFSMEPHNFYDMSRVGAKSQPIVATAFRSILNPEHRLFCSLLITDFFDESTKARVEALLATRQVFSDRAKSLIEKGERQGGLDWNDANDLIREGTDRIFAWTGKAANHQLYTELCNSGFKIAADIACFRSHHLNHLTPNTLCMDLYTTAMKHCMGEIDAADFRIRALAALRHLASFAGRDWMRLHFRHLTNEMIDGFAPASPDAATDASLLALVDELIARFAKPDLRLDDMPHSGFKDTTEGPSHDTPVLLRQDAYKALTEPVEFTNPDGSVVNSAHTARFGEIEQRFYATTPSGLELYNQCLAKAEVTRGGDPELADRDFKAYLAAERAHFAPFPKSLHELLRQGLVYGRYSATPAGIAQAARAGTTDRHELVRLGFARVEGLRFEDFLPVSAAGIFASNLQQYGTKATAATVPSYTRESFEAMLGKPIIEADAVYRSIEANSLIEMYSALGLWDRLAAAARTDIEAAARVPLAASALVCSA